MNSNSQNQRDVVPPIVLALDSVCMRSQRSPIRLAVKLLALMFGLLVSIGLSDQAVAQTPAPSIPGKWTSLVDLGSSNTPANNRLPPANNRPLVRDDFNRSQPLANLRQPDPSGLLTQAPAVELIVGDTNYSNRQNRSDQTLATGWSQPELRHRRLFFEDQQIERGNKQRRFPNFAAGTNFVKSLVAFPIRLVTGR